MTTQQTVRWISATIALLTALSLLSSNTGAEVVAPVENPPVLGAQTSDQQGTSEPRDKPQMFFNPPKSGDVWWQREGIGYTFCDEMYKRLQSFTPKQLGNCVASVVFQLPGVKELEGWRELDPHAYKDLYKSLIQYSKVGAHYFTREYFEQLKLSEETLERKFQLFLKDGGRMRVNEVQVFRHPLADPITTYDRPQTIVELRVNSNKGVCPDAPALTDLVRTFYVTSDLQGPAPDVKPLEALVASNARLVQYKGAVRLMRTTNGFEFFRQTKDGMLHSFCIIEPLKRD